MTNDDVTQVIPVRQLTQTAFAPFGTVIEAPDFPGESVNAGSGFRWRNIAQVDFATESGELDVSIFRACPIALPFTCNKLERHVLSTQMFLPLGNKRFLVLVANGGAHSPDRSEIAAFVTNGAQGVNYKRGVWHHPLVALDEATDFLVIGRSGPGQNFELVELPRQVLISMGGVRTDGTKPA